MASVLSATNSLSPSNSKPTGVDLLIILTMIGGIVYFLGAAVLVVVTSISRSWLEILVGPGIVRLTVLILSALSILLIFYGLTSFFLAYGLWKGRGWAWTWERNSAILGLATSIILLGAGIGIVGVASNALSFYYLNRTEVKVFFGKAPLPESKSLSKLPSMVEKFCTTCGNRLNAKEAYCPSCGSKR